MFYGWRVVAVCFVTAAFAWGLGLFGISVYLHAVTALHGWSVSLVSGAVTLFYLVNACVLTGVGATIDRWGPRPVFVFGALALGGGVAAVGAVSTPWQIYAVFLVMGLGWACLSTTGLTAAVAPWFERQQGRSIAVAIMGASVGAIIGVPALLYGIERLGFAGAVLAAGLLAIAVLVPLATLVLRYRGPAELGLLPDGAAPDLSTAGAAAASPPVRWTRREALRTAALWSVAVAFALGLTVQIGFLTHHVNLVAPSLGAVGAGMLVSATGAAALLGRLVLARIADRVSVRRLAAGILIAQSGALLAMATLPSAPVLVIASLVYGYGVGHVTTLSPIIVRREFGAASFGAIYGSAATVIQVSSAFGPALYGVLRDAFGGYGPGLAIAAVAEVVAAAVVLSGRVATRPAGAHATPAL